MLPARPLGTRDPRWPFQARRLLAAMQRVAAELAEAEEWPAVRVDGALLLGTVLQHSGAPERVVVSVLGQRGAAYCRAVAAAREGPPWALGDEAAERPGGHSAGG